MDDLRGEIDRDGWALEYVQAHDPRRSYGYTVGLTLRDLPEFVISGLPAPVAWSVLNDVAGAATAGHVPSPGDVLTRPGQRSSLTVEAVEDVAHLTRIRELLGPSIPLRALHLRRSS